MKLVTFFVALSLMTGFSAKAQDESLPDLPIMDESAPKEPPFTQPNEFDEAQKLENESTTPSKVPVESSPIVQKPAGSPADPQQVKTQAPPDLPKRKNARQGVDKIEHPLAAKGLIRIEKDGSYIYEVKHAEHTQTATLRLGSIQPPNIEAADGVTDYKTMYSSGSVPVFLFDYEWQPFHSMGKLGVQTGFGLFTSTGNGHFLTMEDGTACTTSSGACQAREKYTFIALPLNLGLVYRFEYTDHQWFAPYVAGGGTYYVLAENRDDDKSLHGVGTPGAYGAGGLMLNISAWDRETAYSLNSEYGITNLWVSLEYRYIKTFSNDLDLTSGMINVGIAVDY